MKEADPDHEEFAAFSVRLRDNHRHPVEWYACCKDCVNEKRRARRARANQRTREAAKRERRERDRLERRQRGVLPTNPTDKRERLPFAPLLSFIEESGLRREELAHRVGISEIRMRTLMRGWYTHKRPSWESSRRYPVENISYLLAQRFMIALDVVLSDVWPDVYGLPT